MISKTPEQRRYYDARMKWERDEATRVAMMEKAIAEIEKANAEIERANAEIEKAISDGEVKGKVAQIHLLQGLLSEPKSNAEALCGMSLSALDELIEGLNTKAQSRLK